MTKRYKITYWILIIILIISIPSMVTADENTTDNTDVLTLTNENQIISSQNNSIIGSIDSHYGGYPDVDVDGPVHGVYYGPYNEPAIKINQFEINTTGKATNNQISVNVTFDGIIYSNIFTLDRFPLTIKENNNEIGAISSNTVSNINYPTDQETPYKFTTSFNYTLKNYTTHLKLRLCGFESNTLVFQYINTLSPVSLNNNSIIIYNKDKTLTSNTSWENTADYLEKAISLAEENSTIQLNNIEIIINKALSINKNITLIGNNATINGFENSNIFSINSKMNMKNITFTNTSNYMLNTNDNIIIENCIFTNTNTKIINNTGILKIINSTFKNINAIFKTPEIENIPIISTLIFNNGYMELKNSTFTNITLPHKIELNNQNIKTSYIIYNNGTLKINNTQFNQNYARIINNTGKLILNKTNISNSKLLPNVVNITQINKKIDGNHIIKSSYIESATPNTITGLISNTDELNITDTTIENLTWLNQKGMYANIINGESYPWYLVYDPYYKIMGFYTDVSNSFLNKAGAIYNDGTLNINTTLFKNLKASDSGAIENEGTLKINNTIFSEITTAYNGGAITSNQKLYIENTLFNHTKAGNSYGDGGAIYTTGDTTITKSNFTYCEGSWGQAILNLGNITVTHSIFDKSKDSSNVNFNGGVLYNGENGNFILTNSTVKNTRFKIMSTWPAMFYGVVINEGYMNVTRCIFDNNTPASPQNIVGSYNLFNSGKMNAEFNIFINTMKSQSQTTRVYAMNNNNDDSLHMNYNYFDYNKDPHNIHTNVNVNQYFVLSLEPDYIPLNINDTTTLNVYLKLNNGKFYTDYSKLPEMNITLNINGENITKTLVNGKTSIDINNTKNKGTYYVTAYYGDWSQKIQIDVGKENSSLEFETAEIYYGENATFNMTVTGNYSHQPQGNITVIIDGKEYTAKIINTKAKLTISGLIPKKYDLIIRYEGDEDYFKAIHHQNYTVHKKPTDMSISISDIYYGETGKIKVTITPTNLATQAYLYITDNTNTTQRKTVYVRNGTELTLKNYAGGNYNITIKLWENKYYESSNASAIFIVKKYSTYLTINTTDITVGQNTTLSINLEPEGEVAGEAELIINNHTEIIFLKNGENIIRLDNLTGGSYTVTVKFPGDKKYAPSNATTIINVKKLNTNITAKIIDNELIISSKDNINGILNVYINDELLKTNISDGLARLKINFTSAENYIFIYFEGNDYYNYTTYNLTYEYLNLVNLTGYDNTTYNGEITYIITLVNENGYGLSNRTITVQINSNQYNITTDNTGLASLTLTLPIGEYNVTASYKNLTVKNILKSIEDALITGMNVKAYSGDDFPYKVTLTDYNKNPLENKEVIFTINGATYRNITDSNGIAVLHLNLKNGDYTITSKYNNVSTSNNITIIDYEELFGRNVVAYENTDFRYNVTLTDSNRNPLSNEEITFTISNKTYTVKTDKNGTASLSLNLNKGNYTIFAVWSNLTRTNNITVIEDAVLTVSDVKVYANTAFNYTVNLKDHYGNALSDKEVKLIINNRAYTQKTDSNGIAILNLNLVEGNYTITVIYNNQTKEGNIEVIEDVHITTHNIKAYADKDFDFTVNLTDHNNHPLKNREVRVNVGNQEYIVKTDSNGIATLTLSLNNGNYSVTTKYNNISVENNFVIVEDAYLKGRNIRAYAYTDFNYTVNLTDSDGNGLSYKEVIFKFNGKTYKSTTNSEGIAILTLSLGEGNYNITATYNTVEIVNRFEILPAYKLNTRNVLMYYKDGTRFTSIITDLRNNPIANKTIEFTVNGAAYTRTSNNNGEASIALNLNSGSYNITTTYENLTNTNTIVIQSTIKGNDITKFFKNGTQYYATFLDKNGELLRNTDVQFNINGVFYTRKTTEEGIARLNINLHQGTYVLTAINPNTKEMHTNTIKVLPVISENYDLIKYYKNDSQFTVKILDGTGNPVNSGESVTFNINGVFYTRTTDSTGHVKLNINLKPGNYTITTDYNGCKVANQIEVISTLQANDLVKNQSTTVPFQAILYNGIGRPLANKEITFNVNGIQTTKTTNRIGIASVNVNLPVGEYLITSSYDDLSIVNRITINAG